MRVVIPFQIARGHCAMCDRGLQTRCELPDAIAEPSMDHVGIDRLGALLPALDRCRRGGTVSLIGVCGGMVDPLPPLLGDDDPLGVDDFATDRLPLDAAPDAYSRFREDQDGTFEVVVQP